VRRANSEEFALLFAVASVPRTLISRTMITERPSVSSSVHTTGGYEVEIACLLVSVEPERHEMSVAKAVVCYRKRCPTLSHDAAKGWGTWAISTSPPRKPAEARSARC
jgi:hypothetical protein